MAAATRTCETTLYGPKPLHLMNGHIKLGYKSENTKTAPPKELGRRNGAVSHIIRETGAGAVGGAVSSNGLSSIKVNHIPLFRQLHQTIPDPRPSASRKNQKKVEKFRRKKKRDHEAVSSGGSDPPPREPEDWESETQEVSLHNWEQICFGLRPFGPEDLLHFSLRDLTLARRDPVDPPVTATYRPSVHHPRPIRWRRYRTPTEPEQFADAGE